MDISDFGSVPPEAASICLTPDISQDKMPLASASRFSALIVFVKSFFSAIYKEWHNINWGNASMLIESARKGGPVSRRVPITDGFLELLHIWHREDAKKEAPEIITWLGKPVLRIIKSWNTAKRKAGITRRLRPYDLRHAFASDALADGADLKSTSKILGHSREETTLRIYQHVNVELQREVVDRLPSFDVPVEGKLKKPKPYKTV